MTYRHFAAFILATLLFSLEDSAQAQNAAIEIGRFGNPSGGPYRSCGPQGEAMGIQYDLTIGTPQRLALICRNSVEGEVVARCPRGEVFTGLIARDDGHLSSINWIRCTRGQSGRHRLLRPSEWHPLGSGRVRRVECPGDWQISAIRSKPVSSGAEAQGTRLALAIYCRAPSRRSD